MRLRRGKWIINMGTRACGTTPPLVGMAVRGLLVRVDHHMQKRDIRSMRRRCTQVQGIYRVAKTEKCKEGEQGAPITHERNILTLGPFITSSNKTFRCQDQCHCSVVFGYKLVPERRSRCMLMDVK